MAASGNVRTTQIRSGDRSGTGAKLGTVTGSLTTAKQLQFDASGNIEASAYSVGSSGSFGYGPTLTAPVDGDFAWINQGGASIASYTGGLHLSAPAVAGNNLRIRKKTAPATPYKIEIAFLPLMYPTASSSCGFVFREASSGKLKVFIYQASNGHYGLVAENSPTSFNSLTADSASLLSANSIIWLRCGDNGTDRTYEFSMDGSNWITWYTEARTTFITADEIGFFADSNSASYLCGMTLVHWKQT